MKQLYDSKQIKDFAGVKMGYDRGINRDQSIQSKSMFGQELVSWNGRTDICVFEGRITVYHINFAMNKISRSWKTLNFD